MFISWNNDDDDDDDDNNNDDKVLCISTKFQKIFKLMNQKNDLTKIGYEIVKSEANKTLEGYVLKGGTGLVQSNLMEASETQLLF